MREAAWIVSWPRCILVHSQAHFLDVDSEMDFSQNTSGHKRQNVTWCQQMCWLRSNVQWMISHHCKISSSSLSNMYNGYKVLQTISNCETEHERLLSIYHVYWFISKYTWNVKRPFFICMFYARIQKIKGRITGELTIDFMFSWICCYASVSLQWESRDIWMQCCESFFSSV